MIEGLRARIPLLDERVYCASQCLGPCLRETFEALDAYRETFHRRSRALDAWIERHDAVHGSLERLLGAPEDSVFVTGTATAAQAAIASCLDPTPGADRIVIGAGDFHSSRYLWRAQAARGFEVTEVASNGPAHAAAETFLDAIDARTALVAVSLVSPRSGALLPVAAIAERCREVSAILLLDAYQAVGIVPIDVATLGAQVVIGGTHKWLHGGGTGLSFGYVEPALAERLEPRYPGWIGNASLLASGDRFVPRAGARRLEQGTPAVEAIYTAGPGIDLALELGVDALRARSLALTGRLIAAMRERGWEVRTPEAPARRGGMVCVDVPAPDDAVTALEAEGVDVDARPGAGVRVGPHPAQTEAEMDRVIAALERHAG